MENDPEGPCTSFWSDGTCKPISVFSNFDSTEMLAHEKFHVSGSCTFDSEECKVVSLRLAEKVSASRDEQDTESMPESIREQAAQKLQEPRQKRARGGVAWEDYHPCGSHLTIACRPQGNRKALVILFADGAQVLQITQSAFGDPTLDSTKEKGIAFLAAVAKKYIEGEIDKDGLYDARDTMMQDPQWGCTLPPKPRAKKAKLESKVKGGVDDPGIPSAQEAPSPVTPPPAWKRAKTKRDCTIREQMLLELSCHPPMGSWESAESAKWS